MSCTFSKDLLALHVEGDLSGRAAVATARHLDGCAECRQFLDELRAAQSLLKALRLETMGRSECRDMRHEVMSVINGASAARGEPIHNGVQKWWSPSVWVSRVSASLLQIERAIVLGFRRPSYALATFVLLGIVSISAIAQMRPVAREATHRAAVFEGRDTLIRPDGYREWTILAVPAGLHPLAIGASAVARRTAAHKVYIDRVGYREYVRTGTFPEGTLMLWESADSGFDVANRSDDHHRPHSGSRTLLASVKDSTRFDGRWGFFDFTGSEGALKAKAQPLPDSSGCRRCHRHT